MSLNGEGNYGRKRNRLVLSGREVCRLRMRLGEKGEKGGVRLGGVYV